VLLSTDNLSIPVIGISDVAFVNYPSSEKVLLLMGRPKELDIQLTQTKFLINKLLGLFLLIY